MEFPKQIRDDIYRLLQEPTLDHLREYLHNSTGECNTIDFKGEWFEGSKLAKEMIGIANIGGGVILFGVHEHDNHTFTYEGLEPFKDKADAYKEIKKFIPSDLKYEIYNFSYDSSEYEALIGKKYQMLVIEDMPQNIPYMALRESGDLKQNRIYIRRGTSVEEAGQEEIKQIINRRIEASYPASGRTLALAEHMEQLQILYNCIKPENSHYEGGIYGVMKNVFDGFTGNSGGKWVSEKNPLYPEESYEEFVARMIRAKKIKIEKVLDLKS